MSSLSNDPKNERRSSVNQRNGFYSYFLARDIEMEKSAIKRNPALLTAESHRARSCSPALLTPTPASWSLQCKTPRQWRNQISHQQLAVLQFLQPQRQPLQLKLPRRKTTTSESAKAAPAIQTELDSYILFKRKLSLQSNPAGNKTKINRVQKVDEEPGRSSSNRFALLAKVDENQPAPDTAEKTQAPSNLSVREKNPGVSRETLVNRIAALIGNGDNFHVVPLIKGNIH
ncbi:uncharacterized protein LOC123257610 [Drosophila ananassae]|uniref:uncharacterized protein LOC123257610 n=1 Tax=Drosophila ananassae TaxID=7217 RepID=UPI001CFFB251|nr:uncharacterized protein LOC123257610 [Drosophila ananassae]